MISKLMLSVIKTYTTSKKKIFQRIGLKLGTRNFQDKFKMYVLIVWGSPRKFDRSVFTQLDSKVRKKCKG